MIFSADGNIKKLMRKMFAVSIISIIVVCGNMSMMFASADSTPAGDSRPGVYGRGKVKMGLELLNVDRGSGPTASPIDAPQINPGDVVWVGVYYENLTKDNWQVLEEYGIQQLKITFNYDKRYLKPYTEYNYKENTADIGDGIGEANFLDSILFFSGWPEKYRFNDAGSNSSQPVNNDNAEPTMISEEDAAAFALHVEVKDTLPVENQRFFASADTSKGYLFKIPMKVISVPTTQTNVIEASLSGNNIAAVFAKKEYKDSQWGGYMNAEWSGEWDAESTDTTLKRNMKNHITFDNNTKDLIPIKNETGLKYGNSPYGLIMADANISEAEKESYKQSFVANKYSFVEGKVPAGGQPGIKYRPDAWEDVNYDQDPFAIFAYSGESFTDPGLDSPKKSDGSGVQESEVKRKITVDVMYSVQPGGSSGNTEIGTSKAADLLEVAKESKGLTTKLSTAQSRDVALSNGHSALQINDLATLNIRPGIYTLEYEYPDVDGKPAITKQRKIIILHKRGDVNLSGEINIVDSNMILNRFLAPQLLGKSMKGTAAERGFYRLYKYRVCDVNMDGNINAVDALCIK